MGKVRRRRTKYNKRNMNNNRHTPSGYKPSPLGPIPEDWEVKRLGDLCFDIFSGSNKTRIDSGKYTVYGSTGIIGKTDEYKYEGERILVARVGAHAGQVSIASGKYDVSDNTIIVENQDCYSLYFAYQYLIASNLNKMVFGSGQPLITAGMLKRMFVVYPPFEEQLKINNVLQFWDTAIAKQTALIEQLTLRKRGLMQQLLTGKKRLKGFGGEWKEARLGEICPMERGEMLTSDNYLQGNISVIAGGKEPAGFHSYANRQKNTITISCSGASAGFVAFHDVPIFATDCFTISESNAYNVWFIYHVLTNLQEKIYKLQTGGAQPHVHPKDVYPMKIHIPSIKEQNVIASVLVNADKEIEIQKQKLAAIQEQKKGLMQVLLTGKRRIL